MLVVLLVVATCLVFWLLHRISRRPTDPPTLEGALPIIGHGHYVLFADVNKLYELFEFIINGSLRGGGVSTTSFGPFNVYVLSDPETSMTVMESCLEKDMFYEFWEAWMGHGMLTAPYSVAKSHRKMMLPAFNQRSLSELLPILNRQSRRLADRLTGHVGKGQFDILPYLALNGLESILSTSLGQTEWDKVALNEYLDAVQKIHKLSIKRFTNVLFHVDSIYKLSGLKKREDEIVEVLHKFSDQVIEQRKSIIDKGTDKTISDDEVTSGLNHNHKIIIDLLLELCDKGEINHKELKDEINTIIFGGHDTTAGTLLYTIILLGSHPEIQDRVYTELQNIFGNSDDDVMKQDLSKFVYMDAVIKESMRLYPFMSFLARAIDKDIKTKNYTLRAGSRCLILVMGMHRHSSWGPDPEAFKPERWLEPDGLPTCPAAFSGFSFGKRSCIGKTYALMTMKVVLVHLLRRYRFTSDHSKLRLKFEVVLKPESGHHVSIERRA